MPIFFSTWENGKKRGKEEKYRKSENFKFWEFLSIRCGEGAEKSEAVEKNPNFPPIPAGRPCSLHALPGNLSCHLLTLITLKAKKADGFTIISYRDAKKCS